MGRRSKQRAGPRVVAGRTAPRLRRSSLTGGAGATGITVVNIIPQSLSSETNQDSEPNLAVNPTNPLQMAASAFTPNPSGAGAAPIFISTDGGMSWMLNAIVPSQRMTADITLRFGATSGILYAGIIRTPIVDDTPRLNVLRTKNFLSPTPMHVLVDRMGQGVEGLLRNLLREQHAGREQLPERGGLPAQSRLHHAASAQRGRRDPRRHLHRSVLLQGDRMSPPGDLAR